MPLENKDNVRNYHSKLTNIRVRIPAPDPSAGIPDYADMIRERAKELGYINIKGADKGQGSANAYILHLIEQDMGIDMIKNMTELKNREPESD